MSDNPIKRTTSDLTDGPLADDVLLTLSAIPGGSANAIYKIVVSFNLAPTTAVLAVDNGGLGEGTIFHAYLPLAAGVHVIDLSPGIYGDHTVDTVVSVTGTGVGVTASLNVLSRPF